MNWINSSAKLTVASAAVFDANAGFLRFGTHQRPNKQQVASLGSITLRTYIID